LVSDVSVRSTGPIFKVRVQEEWLTVENGLICCPEQSVTNYQPMPPIIPEEQRPQQHRGGILYFCLLFVIYKYSIHIPCFITHPGQYQLPIAGRLLRTVISLRIIPEHLTVERDVLRL